MDTKKRVTRKPLTTVSWVAVLTAMALLLGIGANLLHSADSLLDTIDQQHTTIAVQTMEAGLTAEGNYQNLSVTLNKSEIEELRALDSVELVDLRTLTGAYIPELSGQIGLAHWGTLNQLNYDVGNWETSMNETYNEVILTGVVEQCWQFDFPYAPDNIFGYDGTKLGYEEPLMDQYLYALVEIEELIVAHPDYAFYPSEAYTAYTGKVFVEIPSYMGQGDDFLQAGDRYIFCGTYNPRCYGTSLAGHDWPLDDEFYPWLVVDDRYSIPGAEFRSTHVFRDGDTLFYYDNVDVGAYYGEPKEDEVNLFPITLKTEHKTPAVARIDGSVEEFLAENQLWADAAEAYTELLHCFPVIGTEVLETMYAFNRSDAVMIDGRYFTQEEYDTGAKVCVISESAAQTGDIQVGGTIHLSQYDCGSTAEEGNTSLHTEGSGGSLNNPSAGRFPPEEYVTVDEEFTVVGIYQLQRSWDSSSFSFTPNTVFIPQKAQIDGGFGGASYSAFGGADYNAGYGRSYPNGIYGIYFSVQIKNGMADEFLTQAGEIVPNGFHIYDQGYEAAQESVKEVGRDAWKLMGLAGLGWLLLLALYLVLYQNAERHNLGIMRSLGATPGQCTSYLFGSGFALAAAGIFLGTLLSSQATRMVSGTLAEFMVSADAMLNMSSGQALGSELLADILSRSTLPMSTLLLLTAAQLAVMAAALYLHARAAASNGPRKLLAA